MWIHNLGIGTFGQLCLHLLVGLLITILFRKKPLTALLLASLAGIGKELFDYFSYGLFDWLDLLFTVLPALLWFAWVKLQVAFWKALLNQ